MITTALQQAIFDKLNSDLSVPVYDDTPDNKDGAYVVIGNDTINEFSADDRIGYDCTITLHAWTIDYKGNKLCKQLIDDVIASLDRHDLAVTGHHCTGLDFEFANIERESDNTVRHGVIRFRTNIFVV